MKIKKNRKILVVDTSIFTYDAFALKSFKDSHIIIPITVVEELDKVKKLSNEHGKNARVAIRYLDEISKNGEIHLGIEMDNNCSVQVDVLNNGSIGSDPSYGDNKILFCAISAQKLGPTTLVTRDVNLRIKARALGLNAEEYNHDRIDKSELYTGVQKIVNEEIGAALISAEELSADEFPMINDLYPNECVIFLAEDEKVIVSGRKVKNYLKIVRDKDPWGLIPKNSEQKLAIDMLLDPKLPLVSITGLAGSGKSLCALACGLEQVLNSKKYSSFPIYKPISSVGDSVGYLPGPQPLDAKILTPTGWTTMGELKIGSEVISRNGKKTEVLNIYPKGIKPVYKITTTDGTSTECCEDHLWLTQTAEDKKRNRAGNVKTTKEIISTLKNNAGKLNHFLPRNEAIEYNKRNLLLPPYLMGVILGDGHIGDSVSIANIDMELVKRVEEEIKQFDLYLCNSPGTIRYSISGKFAANKPARPVKITNILTDEEVIYERVGLAELKAGRQLDGACKNNRIINGFKYEFLEKTNRWTNPVKDILYKYGLYNKRAWDKFIPEDYKYSDIEDRISLLRGLMDTDGTIKKNGETSYCTTSKQLAMDMIELVRSLGGRAYIRERDRTKEIRQNRKNGDRDIKYKRISYEFNISLPNHINPFYISRKSQRYKKSYIHYPKIKSIELVGEKEVQCILIDNSEHLYITDNFIVTHNTLSEKLDPHFVSIDDGFQFLLSDNLYGKQKSKESWKEKLYQYTTNGTITKEAISYIRGRNIISSFILIDEAQNLNREEIKTIVTRTGIGSKIVLLGDINQIDSPGLDATSNGLSYLIEKFKKSNLSGHITFSKGERSALASEAAELL